MKIALIAPVSCLDLVAKYNTGYHLVLPHVLKDSPVYTSFYKTIEGYKILDNGEAENVHVHPNDLHRCAEEINADEIVVQDVMGSYRDTVQAASSFEKYTTGEFKYQAVVQGSDMAEVLACLNYYTYTKWVDVVAIPRILAFTIHKSFRYTFLDALFNTSEQTYKRWNGAIHCLGASAWTREVAALADLPHVRGLDTSLPFVMGLDGRKLDAEYAVRKAGYFEAEVERRSLTYKLIEDNVKRYLDWAGCELIGDNK